MYHQIRQMTPPSMHNHMVFPNSADSYNSSRTFFTSGGNSPESVLTEVTAPSRDCSPGTTLCHSGPPLLPKIRYQDQTTEPTAGPIRHQRTVSAQAGFQYSPYPYGIQRQPAKRRRTRSPEGRELNSPASVSFPPPPMCSATAPPSTVTSSSSLAVQLFPDSSNFGFGSTLDSPIAFPESRRSSFAHVRTSSLPATHGRGHSRTASGSSVDEATIRRHGYPTQYRNLPQFQTHAPSLNTTPAMIAPPMQLSYSAGSSYLINEPPLSFDEEISSVSFPEETTSLLSYLSKPNPTSHLIAQSSNSVHNPSSASKNRDWWWWDVRTLRNWSDFNIDTILSIKDFPKLLSLPQDASQFPHPPASVEKPADEQKLRETHHRFFSAKINAAMKATTGKEFFMSTRNTSHSTSPWPKPDFISNYASDYMTTHRGETRGRLVGLVKGYDLWNCAMRTSDQPAQQVKYLHGLSHLHRAMRENGCRYGFIITEIELLCVRMGAKDDEFIPSSQPHLDEGPVPWFGYLEIAPRIELSTQGQDPKTGAPRLTAALALWYLHMLAKENGLPGQPGWKIGVGGPAARTRQYRLDRDSWMPKMHDGEKRAAKTSRGWVFPEDPWNKKENIKKRK